MNSRVNNEIVLQFQVVVDYMVVISCGLSQLVSEKRLVAACHHGEFSQREVFQHALRV